MNRMASAASLASYNKIYLSAYNVVTWSFAWCPNEDVQLRDSHREGRSGPLLCAPGGARLSAAGAASSRLAQGSACGSARGQGRAGLRTPGSWARASSLPASLLHGLCPALSEGQGSTGLCHWP